MPLACQRTRLREQVTGIVAAMIRNAREFTEHVESSPMDATRSDPGGMGSSGCVPA
jgi:hypothetical protein